MSPRHFRDNIENILKSPVTLFKKKSMKFYLLLEVESHRSKDVKNNVKKKNGECFLELICFIFLFVFQE